MLSRHLIERFAAIYEGIAVWGCVPGSPAERAGLRTGDIVLAVNGVRTRDVDSFISARKWQEGAMAVRVVREGQEMDLVLLESATKEPTTAELAQFTVSTRAFAASSFGGPAPTDDPS